jgi:hypothetical protein
VPGTNHAGASPSSVLTFTSLKSSPCAAFGSVVQTAVAIRTFVPAAGAVPSRSGRFTRPSGLPSTGPTRAAPPSHSRPHVPASTVSSDFSSTTAGFSASPAAPADVSG